MEFFGGLDVSIDETAVCVVDDKGAVSPSNVGRDGCKRDHEGAETLFVAAAARGP